MSMVLSEYQPTTLEEAVNFILKNIDDIERDVIRNTEAFEHHHTVGRDIRNSWGLWAPKQNAIKEHFLVRFHLTHPDDISAIILESVFAQVKGVEFDPHKLASEFISYWNKQNVSG